MNKFSFNDSYSKMRGGFKHTSQLFNDGVQIGIGTARYYNRTWEKYPYQTTRKRAVEQAIINCPGIATELKEFLQTL